MDSFIPQRFGKFFLVDLLGKGGMAVVFLATEISKFDQFHPQASFVALKQLFPKYSAQEGFVKCLVDEAKLTSLLKHPNIVEVLDLGNVGTDFYMTMNWVNGKSFYHLLDSVRNQNKVISKTFLFYIFQKVAEGLLYAHELKDSANRPLDMVHCDVSPQNILLGYEGEVKLSDFGIATAEKSKEKAGAEALLGKLPYMAPEQITLKGFDRRVDIYSFGVLMFEGLTGRKPFNASSVQQLQTKIIKEQPQFTSRVFQSHPNVREFIQSCLEKNPENRPDSMAEFFKLNSEVEDVDSAKISKLMKLLFKPEIVREQINIDNATEVLVSIQEQPDLLGDEEDGSFSYEKSLIRPTEIMPVNASHEMTKVLLDKPTENVGKIQIKKKEILRVVKKKPIEEEWIDSETTQRRMSRELTEVAEQVRKEANHVDDLFEKDSDEEEFSMEMPKVEKTVVDFDESLEKKWEALQGNLRKGKKSTPSPLDNDQTKEHKGFAVDDMASDSIAGIVEQDFHESYPTTGEVKEFSKLDQTVVSAPVDPANLDEENSSENETKEAKIQLKLVKRPMIGGKIVTDEDSVSKKKSSSTRSDVKRKNDDFFDEASKPKIDESALFKYKKIISSNDTLTFHIKRRTFLAYLVVGLLIFTVLATKKSAIVNFFSVRKPVVSSEIKVVDIYISMEEFGNAKGKQSASLWMDPTFQRTFIGPIQRFFDREYRKYTDKTLPFRFVFDGFERDTSKIPWQGSLFNSYLPFEKFYTIFQIDSKKEDHDHGRLFVHLYQKELNGPTEYPIDYQGKRPIHSGVLYYPLFSEDDNEFQLRIAHEILHMLGAKDLYNSKGLPKYPEGYVEPFKEPLHPQTFGEIMSRTIPQNPSEYIPLSNLDDARIGPDTAYQIGWITEKQLDQYYQR